MTSEKSTQIATELAINEMQEILSNPDRYPSLYGAYQQIRNCLVKLCDSIVEHHTEAKIQGRTIQLAGLALALAAELEFDLRAHLGKDA